MKCTNCGKELAPTAKFCNSCGTKVVVEEVVDSGYQTENSTKEDNKTFQTKSKGNGDKKSIFIVIGIFFVAALVGFLVKGMMNPPASGNNPDYVQNENAEDEMNQEQMDEESNTEGDSELPVVDTTEENVLPQGYLLAESNTRLLTVRDLEGFTAEQCRIARNEIYARHGRIFKDEALAAHFGACDWYRPTIQPEAFNEEAVLNQYEKANRDLIVDYEKAKGYR